MPSISDIFQFVVAQFFGSTFVPKVDLTGKTFIVTGANTGLGLDASKHLARLPASRIILACRNRGKGDAAATAIHALPRVHKNTVIEVWEVDLDHHASVLAFCDRVNKDLDRLDGVVCNAGVELVEFEKSEDVERTLNINVVSTIMLAQGVLLKLTKSAETHGADTNLTIVGSLIHFFAPTGQLRIPEERSILDGLSDVKTADMAQLYPLSKLLIHLCFNEIIKTIRSDGKHRVTANLVNPGWCASELSRNKPSDFFERSMFAMIGRTAEEGSRTLVHGVTAGRETHGKYLSECQVKKQSSFVRGREGVAAQKRLWSELPERSAKVSPNFAKGL